MPANELNSNRNEMADRKRAKKVMHDFNLIHADTKANKNQMEKNDLHLHRTIPFHPYVLPTIIISHNCILLTRSTGRGKNSSRVCVSLYYFRFVNAIVESRHQIQSQCRTLRAWAESLCINHAIALAWESIHLCNISFTSLFQCVWSRARSHFPSILLI